MSILSAYNAVAEAISLLLHPYGEVVIHDLKSGTIAAIFNNLSKRKVGDESLIEETHEGKKLPDVFPVYTKTNWDGRKMRSSTATLRDKGGKPIGLLCINLDVSRWEDFRHMLDQWLGSQNQPEVLFNDDWREKINVFVTAYLKKAKAVLKGLSKTQKQELVRALHREGAFKAKNGAAYVADVLDLSRATVYNYLRNGS
jgi:predicted transcriptional regulator YheO